MSVEDVAIHFPSISTNYYEGLHGPMGSLCVELAVTPRE